MSLSRAEDHKMIVLIRVHRVHQAVRDEDKAVGGRVTAAERAFRLFEHADDAEDLVADLNLFIQRLVSGEELLRDLLTDDGDLDVVMVLGFGEEAPARDAHFTRIGVAGPYAANLRRADFVVAELDRGRQFGRDQDRRPGRRRRQLAQSDRVFERDRLALALLLGEIAVARADAETTDESHVTPELLDLF